MAEVDTHLNGTVSGADSGAACLKTTAALLSVPFAAHRRRAALV